MQMMPRRCDIYVSNSHRINVTELLVQNVCNWYCCWRSRWIHRLVIRWSKIDCDNVPIDRWKHTIMNSIRSMAVHVGNCHRSSKYCNRYHNAWRPRLLGRGIVRCAVVEVRRLRLVLPWMTFKWKNALWSWVRVILLTSCGLWIVTNRPDIRLLNTADHAHACSVIAISLIHQMAAVWPTMCKMPRSKLCAWWMSSGENARVIMARLDRLKFYGLHVNARCVTLCQSVGERTGSVFWVRMTNGRPCTRNKTVKYIIMNTNLYPSITSK